MSQNVFLIPVAATALLEQALNGVLALEPASRAKLAQLDGKVIGIDLKGTGLKLFIRIDGERMVLMNHFDGEADTTLRGAPISMLRMSFGDATKSLFEGDVEIHGDVDLGQRFKRLLDSLEIDWEEHISRITGDVIAHQLGNLARGFAAWGRRSVDTLGRDAAEYLKYEQDILPDRYETDQFMEQVDTLRSDVDRLEARIKRLIRNTTTQDD